MFELSIVCIIYYIRIRFYDFNNQYVMRIKAIICTLRVDDDDDDDDDVYNII